MEFRKLLVLFGVMGINEFDVEGNASRSRISRAGFISKSRYPHLYKRLCFALCVLPGVSYSVPKPTGYKFASLVSFHFFLNVVTRAVCFVGIDI